MYGYSKLPFEIPHKIYSLFLIWFICGYTYDDQERTPYVNNIHQALMG